MLASSPLPFARAGAPADDHSDGFHPCGQRYWPAQTLDAFLLQMAARGHCISAAMMLGDRQYALEQISRARQLPGDTLQALVQELSAYFEDAEPAAAGLHWSYR